MTVENKEMITLEIPTKIKVEASRLVGDTESPILIELFDRHTVSMRDQEALDRGVRIFITKKGKLYLKPEETEAQEKS